MRPFIFLALCVFSTISMAQIDTINFENNSLLVDIDTAAGNIWQIGKPSKVIFDSAWSAPRAIVTDTVNPYPINNISRFTLGFELYGGQPFIEFRHRFDTDLLHDGGFMEISNDSGQSWVLLSDTTFTDPNGNGGFFYQSYGLETYGFYGVNDSLSPADIGFSGRSNGWITSGLMFRCFAIKKSLPLMLRFTFVSDSINSSRDGWMIDEIIIDNQGGCSDLSENSLLPVTAYPNPFSTSVRIELADIRLTEGSYELFDLQGRKLSERRDIYGSSFEIERETLKSGAYLLIVYDSETPVSMGKIFVR